MSPGFSSSNRFYLGPKRTAVASLRYFNHSDISFEILGYYFVWAQIAKSVPDYCEPKLVNVEEQVEEQLTGKDFQLVGDIVWLIPTAKPVSIPRSFIVVAGPACNVNTQLSTFDIDAYQFTSGISKQMNHPLDSILPIRVYFDPDDHRWKHKKPIPSANTYIQVQGYLTRFDLNDSGFPDRFHVQVESMTLLGKSAVPKLMLEPETPTPVSLGKWKPRGSFYLEDNITPEFAPRIPSQSVHDPLPPSSPLSEVGEKLISDPVLLNQTHGEDNDRANKRRRR
ncbi:hypothetical protein K435DRAFT_810742 [Dendrothele bispora CBS 962.96]|uniref:Uncharacterized protein n=1 Tax=Dendrothele bispora (strain CBS 962.96) TaxID=1314807 RepID=A0A4S8KUJ8_DENBC|nr:hypothetical protein K435DRAFT_810742 [Dendrothele bispora CBS 962.96]